MSTVNLERRSPARDPWLKPSMKLTYEDFLHFPDDGRRHELLDGEHVVTPSPFLRHQVAVGNLHLSLGNHLRGRKLGRLFLAPFDIVLSPHDVVEPDLLYLGQDRLDRITEKNVQGSPDLAIEVLSSSTRGRDRTIKRRIYRKFGVREYWMVDTKALEVTVVRFAGSPRRRDEEIVLGAADRLTSPLFPEWSMAVVEVFSDE